jgi:sugar lactone lactonase YvrE
MAQSGRPSADAWEARNLRSRPVIRMSLTSDGAWASTRSRVIVKCDSAGRLLAGTTAFDFSPHSAALYRVEPDWSFEQVVRDLTQSNGIAWSPSGSRMYFIDSATQGVDVFDYDVGTGSAGNRRRLVPIDRPHGIPDGMTADNGGNLWVA